ncbi:MAG: hypothetical protein M1838_004203 [Thelocarpon superellum]|nr:MAG: hypothetical protein M1838_004203 [Thelocarpon superellum]
MIPRSAPDAILEAQASTGPDEMETTEHGAMQRTSSYQSNASNASRRSSRARTKARRNQPSASIIPTASPSDKSLTSFPSLSPPSSPIDLRPHPPPNALRPSRPTSPQRSAAYAPPSVDTLMTPAPSTPSRSALFDDTPLHLHHVPGALHYTTDEHIERLIARNGAIALVRQLAQDLAQRDAQATALRRRAEERERILRKMLRDCEVSHQDIETRLSENEKSLSVVDSERSDDADQLPPADHGIDELMGQAMSEDVGPADIFGSGYLGRGGSDVDERPPDASEHLSGILDPPRLPNARSRPPAKGWRDYLLGGAGTTRKGGDAPGTVRDLSDDTEATPKARMPSTGGIRRKGLQSNLFQPPEMERSRSFNPPTSQPMAVSQTSQTVPTDDLDSDAQSNKSASSVAAWALKLVAGNPQGGKREPMLPRDPPGSRGSRQPSISSIGSATSGHTPQPRTRGPPSSEQKPRRSTAASHLGPNGTVKAPTSATSMPGTSSPHGSDVLHQSSNVGPVEMDTILPPDSRPPTLLQTYHAYHATDYLTDRFGFIYDHRRKRRQREAAERTNGEGGPAGKLEMLSPSRTSFARAEVDTESDRGSPIETESTHSGSQHGSRPTTGRSTEVERGRSNPIKGWQDFLKTATYPTELLSHTPSAGAILTLRTVDADGTAKPAPIVGPGRGPLPSASAIPPPLTSPIVVESATFAKDIPTGPTDLALAPKDTPEPVRLLLEQLTELHDSLQRDRTVKWNEFLRKVRAERRREGEAAAGVGGEGRMSKAVMPEVSLADGEMVGVAGLGNKGKVGRAKWREFKGLVLGGIPVAYRAKIWAECSGASALRVPGQYEDLVKNGADDVAVVVQIGMDIHRTLTDNIFFRKGPGVAKLDEVLRAYSHRNPNVGYCQGMNLITASLLLIMPTAEDAFWVLTSMIENILPPHYYDHSLLASRADQQVLRGYVTEVLPTLSAHLDALGIELEALTFQWFLSVFTDCLSAEALFRVWDVVLCTNDGSTFLFQVALALLKLNEPALLDCKTPARAYSYINHQMTNHAISIDGLLQASEALKSVVQRDDVLDRRARVMAAEQERMRERAERVERSRSRAPSAAAGERELGDEAGSLGHAGSIPSTDGV